MRAACARVLLVRVWLFRVAVSRACGYFVYGIQLLLGGLAPAPAVLHLLCSAAPTFILRNEVVI